MVMARQGHHGSHNHACGLPIISPHRIRETLRIEAPMYKHLVFRALAVAAAATGTAALLPGAAQAAPYPCPDEQICIYSGLNQTGSVAILPALQPRGATKFKAEIADFRGYTFYNGKTLNDAASSITNNTNHWVFLYQDGHYNGYTLNKKPGEASIMPQTKANFDGSPIFDFTPLPDNTASSITVGQSLSCDRSDWHYDCHMVPAYPNS
ncbi:peptidase inhibitor family I36 protein [Micromonospora vinacea]|uniref:peptidase inhibitor family I36 protein n=1 Tax=Micromonospora vinacea TaxID=709878 RepID=UPI0027DA6C42|nr:peptidase inhibitor family I36 protein [Micromonospora vinacea]WTA71112.1 peptidase inhibitor family I36 protein [Micromonospora sp. NBC_00855]